MSPTALSFRSEKKKRSCCEIVHNLLYRINETWQSVSSRKCLGFSIRSARTSGSRRCIWWTWVAQSRNLALTFFCRVAASWFVTTKLSESGSPDHNVKVLSVLANIATEHSKFNGCGDVTADLITRQENLLMRALSFNLSIPTVCTWNFSLCARLNVVTMQKITGLLHNLYTVTHRWLEGLVCELPSTPRTSPETLAVGALFCLLVEYGAVHCEEVRKQLPQQTQHVAIGISPDALENAFEYATQRTMPEIISFSAMVLKASQYFKIAKP